MDINEFNKKQEFIRDAMPSEWLEYGTELKDAAEILWAQENMCLRVEATVNAEYEAQSSFKAAGISRPYILLSAFAIENLLKGLLVSQDPSHITSGKLSKEVWGHNLLALAAKVQGLQLSQQEREICQIAQDALPYWGRYPVPKDFQTLKTEEIADEQYRGIFLKLHHRLSKCIYDVIRDGWDSGAGPQTMKYRDVSFSDSIDSKETFF